MPTSKKRGIFSFFSSSKKSTKEKSTTEEKTGRAGTVNEKRNERIEEAATVNETVKQSNGQIPTSSNDKEQSTEASKSCAERIPSTKKHRAPDPPVENADESEKSKLNDELKKDEELSTSHLDAADEHAEVGSHETQKEESGSSNIDKEEKVEDISEKEQNEVKDVVEGRKSEAATSEEIPTPNRPQNSDAAGREESLKELETKSAVSEVNLDDIFPAVKETNVVVDEHLTKPTKSEAQEVQIVIKETSRRSYGTSSTVKAAVPTTEGSPVTKVKGDQSDELQNQSVSVRESVGKIEARKERSQNLHVSPQESKSISLYLSSPSTGSRTSNSPSPNNSRQKPQTSSPPVETNRGTKSTNHSPNKDIPAQRPKSCFGEISPLQNVKRSSNFAIVDNATPSPKSKPMGSKIIENGPAGSDNGKLQREYSLLKKLFDEWKLLCSDPEMQKNPRTLKLQSELMEQLKYVQELCASSGRNAPPNITMPFHAANIKKRPPIGKYSFSPPSPQTLNSSGGSAKKISKKMAISRSYDLLDEAVDSAYSIPEERESEEESHKDSPAPHGPPHSYIPLLKTQFVAPQPQETAIVPQKSKNDFSKPVHVKAFSYNGVVKPPAVSPSKDSKRAISPIAEDTQHDKWNDGIRPDEKGWVTSTLRLGAGIKKSDDKELALLRIQHEIEVETKRQNELIRMRKEIAGQGETGQSEAKPAEDIQPEVKSSHKETEIPTRKNFSASQKPKTISTEKKGSDRNPIYISIFNDPSPHHSLLQNANAPKEFPSTKQPQKSVGNLETRANTGDGIVISKKLELEKKRDTSSQIQSDTSKNFKPSTEVPKSSAQTNGFVNTKKRFEPTKSNPSELKHAPRNTNISPQHAYYMCRTDANTNKSVLQNEQRTNASISLVGINTQPQKNDNDDKPKQNSAPKVVTHETKTIIQQSQNSKRAKLDIVVNPSYVYSQSAHPSRTTQSSYGPKIQQTTSISAISKQTTTVSSGTVMNGGNREDQQRNSVSSSQFKNSNPSTVSPSMDHSRRSMQWRRDVDDDNDLQREGKVASHQSKQRTSDGTQFVMPHLKKVDAPVERTGFKLGTVLDDKEAAERSSNPGTSSPSSPTSHYDVPVPRSSNFASIPPPPPGPAPSISSLPSPGKSSSSSSIPPAPSFQPLSSSLSTPLSSTPNSSHSSLLPLNPGDDYERRERIRRGLSPMTAVDPAILMAEMKKVHLRPATPVARIRQNDSREDLMQEIRLAGGIKSLRKTSAKA